MSVFIAALPSTLPSDSCRHLFIYLFIQINFPVSHRGGNKERPDISQTYYVRLPVSKLVTAVTVTCKYHYTAFGWIRIMTLNLSNYTNKPECYCHLKVSVIQLYCDSEKESNHMLGIPPPRGSNL